MPTDLILPIVCTRDWCNLFYLQCWCAPLRCYSTKKTCVLRSQRVTIRNYTRFECGMIINFLLFIRLEWGRMSPLIASAHRAAEHCVQKLKYLPLKYGEITTYTELLCTLSKWLWNSDFCEFFIKYFWNVHSKVSK